MKKYKFELWLSRWKLIPDGSPFATHTSQLLPVKTSVDGIKAMLKITDDQEEQRGNALMAWWGGSGAAQVISHEKEARHGSRISIHDVQRRSGHRGLPYSVPYSKPAAHVRNSHYHNLLLLMTGSTLLNQLPGYMGDF